MQNRPIKDGFYRQQNDIHLNNVRDQSKYPGRNARMGANRQRNNQRHGRQFEINRNRASGMRQRIQFNATNNTHNGGQFHGRRNQRPRFNHPELRGTTINPTAQSTMSWGTATATMTPSPATWAIETTTKASPNVISNDVIHYDDNTQYQRRNEEIERRWNEERLRKKQMEQQWRLDQERLKEMRQHDRNVRRQKDATERVPTATLDKKSIRNERTQPNLRQQHDTNDNRHVQQPARQTDRLPQQQHQHIEQTNDERAVQTNEIFGGPVPTAAHSMEMKKLKRKQLRERLHKLSPEQQQLFFQRKAEKNRKRAN